MSSILFYLSLGGRPAHQKLFALALPMILANLTTPLVGLVDTAVLGRLDSPASLAGASVATLIITQLIWVCGFLRMSVTGLSGQAFGAGNKIKQSQILWQNTALGLALGVVLWILHQPILLAGLYITGLPEGAASAATEYFTTRAFSLPASMMNLVLVGWMIGQQMARWVLVIQVIGNALNVALNLLFVLVFELGITGVASATVLADYTMFALSVWFIIPRLEASVQREWFNRSPWRGALNLNRDILIRNLVLQVTLAFLTLQGARYGVIAAAVNAIVMQIYALIALGLDGVAYALEALSAEALGKRKRKLLIARIIQGTFWSGMLACVYTTIFVFFFIDIAELLTHYTDVINALDDYWIIVCLLPLFGHWIYLFDGIAVGLTMSKAMRDTMWVSAVFGFFLVWWLCESLGNIALWIAMLIFLACRAITLAWVFVRQFDRLFESK